MYLGLDLGTGSAKAPCCSTPTAPRSAKRVPRTTPSAPMPAGAEIDWKSGCRRSRRASKPCRRAPAPRLKASAFRGRCTAWCSDAKATPCDTPSCGWTPPCRRPTGTLSTLADSLKRLGNAPSAGMAGPILLWLAEHEPIGCKPRCRRCGPGLAAPPVDRDRRQQRGVRRQRGRSSPTGKDAETVRCWKPWACAALLAHPAAR